MRPCDCSHPGWLYRPSCAHCNHAPAARMTEPETKRCNSVNIEPSMPDERETLMHAHEVQDEVAGAGRELRARIPEVYAGYVAMAKAATAEGEVTSKTKELIAL